MVGNNSSGLFAAYQYVMETTTLRQRQRNFAASEGIEFNGQDFLKTMAGGWVGSLLRINY